MVHIIRKISDEDFVDIIKNSITYSESMRKCGINNVGNTRTIKKRIEELNLDISHFSRNYDGSSNRTYTNEKVFIENSLYNDRAGIKKRLMRDFGWDYKCNSCGISEWKNREKEIVKISLELEHINGINNDHRIENLEFLCPNCHSTTSTFRGKNKYNDPKSIIKSILNDIIDNVLNRCIDCKTNIYKKSDRCDKCNKIFSRKIRPSLEQLKKDIKELNYVQTGKKYNVSDNCIRKWIKNYENDI